MWNAFSRVPRARYALKGFSICIKEMPKERFPVCSREEETPGVPGHVRPPHVDSRFMYRVTLPSHEDAGFENRASKRGLRGKKDLFPVDGR